MDTVMGDFLRGFFADLEKYGTVCVAGHLNPDGDAVGACFAMVLFLEQIGAKPVLVIDEYNGKFGFLKGGEFANKGDSKDFGVCVCLDCAARERLGISAGAAFDGAAVRYNIDHHVSNTRFADVNYVDTEASSTCEIVYDIIEKCETLTKDMAAALYTGILSDTGGFRHGCTSPKTLRAAARLVECGVDFPDIYRRVLMGHSLSEARAFGLALSGMEVCAEMGFAMACLDYETMVTTSVTGLDLDGIVEYMLNMDGVKVSALLSEREKGIVNVSLRSVKVNVSVIASEWGGGGHEHAAGAKITAAPAEAARAVTLAVKEAMGLGT